jgi:hypothetical protein
MALSPKQPERSVNLALSFPHYFFSSFRLTLIGLGQLSTPQSICSFGADTYVNHPKSPPSHLQDYNTCNSASFHDLSKSMVHEKWSPQRGV